MPKNILSTLSGSSGGTPAVILPECGAVVSYESLRNQVTTMAEILAGAGVCRGDRVATVFPNGLPAIVTFLAASVAGTVAPLNPAYRHDEFSFYIQDTKASLLLCPEEGAEEARNAARQHNIPVLAVTMDTPGTVRVTNASEKKGLTEPGPDDTALVLHTSGSTGRPKRVPLKHRNLISSCANIIASYELSGEDTSLCLMPLFHVHGLIGSMLSTLHSGGAVCVPAKFNPSALWGIVQQHRVTWFSAVPALHQLLMARMGGKKRLAGTDSMRFIRSCSSPLSAPLMETLEEKLGLPVLQAYGMTEASHQISSNRLAPQARKAGSVGVPTGVDVSIVDEGGKHLFAGQVGEVVLRGPNITEAYETDDPEINITSFYGEWFRTGDQGVLDESGFLTLTGRLKEMINRGGEKVAPLEIDRVLLSHPSVSEAVAFGVSHPVWGEEVAAAVVLRDPQPESVFLDYCRRRLTDYKCPVKIFIVDSIPRTATGKVQRLAVAHALSK